MSSSGVSSALQSLLNQGEAAGSQAQFNIYLQLIQRLVAAIESMTPSAASPFTNYPWTGGNLNISTDFPSILTGTFSLSPASPGPITVTIPPTGGPWLIVDGTGFCSPSNQITIEASGGATVAGVAAYYFVQSRQSGIFILDTSSNNYNVF